MNRIKEEVICENCEAEFVIEYNEGDRLSLCPFCGEPLESDVWPDDSDWSDYDSEE